MVSYQLLLHGLRSRDEGIPGPLLRDLLDAVDDSARGAVRLRLAGRSAAGVGQGVEWIERAASFNVVGFTSEVPGIELQAPSLADAVPPDIASRDIAGQLAREESALNLLNVSLGEALAGSADSDTYDGPLLETFREFERVFHYGVDALELRNGRWDAPGLHVTPQGLDVVRQLQRRTPGPRRVRLAGRIVEAWIVGELGVRLQLASGEYVRCVLVKGRHEPVAKLFGEIAIVSGLARFRPSGKLLRVDAERIVSGTERDVEAWSVVPRPLDGKRAVRETWQPQGPDTGLNAIIGKWPGDETDEEIFRLLEEMS